MLVNLKLKFKLSLVYWLNSTQFKIESKISFLRKILRNILRFGKFFCYKLPNHVQIYDLWHFLGKIITLLNLCLVLLLEQSIVHYETHREFKLYFIQTKYKNSTRFRIDIQNQKFVIVGTRFFLKNHGGQIKSF